MKHRRDKKKILILSALTIICIGLFLFQGLNSRNFDYNISRRIPKIIAMCLTGTSIEFLRQVF